MRELTVRFDGVCNVPSCRRPVRKGETIGYDRGRRRVYCRECLEQHVRDVAADDFDLMNNACM